MKHQYEYYKVMCYDIEVDILYNNEDGRAYIPCFTYAHILTQHFTQDSIKYVIKVLKTFRNQYNMLFNIFPNRQGAIDLYMWLFDYLCMPLLLKEITTLYKVVLYEKHELDCIIRDITDMNYVLNDRVRLAKDLKHKKKERSKHKKQIATTISLKERIQEEVINYYYDIKNKFIYQEISDITCKHMAK